MTDTPGEDARENELRALAAQHGLELAKAPSPADWGDDDGGYMLVDPARDYVVFGAIPAPFSASLDEVETYLAQPDAPPAGGADS